MRWGGRYPHASQRYSFIFRIFGALQRVRTCRFEIDAVRCGIPSLGSEHLLLRPTTLYCLW